MTAPQTPPLSAEDARERALAEWRRMEPDAPWSPRHDEAFRDGWGNNGLGTDWLPSIEEANLAGRRAARAYARTLATGDADATR